MPTLFSYDLVQFKGILGRFSRAKKTSRGLSRKIARQFGTILIAELKKEAPVGTHYVIHYPSKSVTVERPETLKKSLRFRSFIKPWGVILRIYAAPHVNFIINDVKGHRVTAKNRPVLTFYWPNAPAEVIEMFGGKIVHFKSIWVPFRKANKFHERALKAVTPELQKLLKKHAVSVKDVLEGN